MKPYQMYIYEHSLLKAMIFEKENTYQTFYKLWVKLIAYFYN